MYETEIMDNDKANRFIEWFMDEIGTDYEKNEMDGGYYFILLDLVLTEVGEVRNWELDNE